MESITKNELEKSLNAGDKLILTLSASWCGPCKMLTPALEKLTSEYSDVKFYKNDIEQHPDLTNSLGITGVPTILFYSGGKLKYKHVGATSSSVLKKYIEEHL